MGWMPNAMRRPFYPRETDPVPNVQEAGGTLRPVWVGAENLAPTEIRFSDSPARSKSHYRLRYPDPLKEISTLRNFDTYFLRALFYTTWIPISTGISAAESSYLGFVANCNMLLTCNTTKHMKSECTGAGTVCYDSPPTVAANRIGRTATNNGCREVRRTCHIPGIFGIKLRQGRYRSLLHNCNASGQALVANRRQTFIYFGCS